MENYVIQESALILKDLLEIFKEYMVSFRVWNYKSITDDSIHILGVTMQVGCNGSTDNVTSGELYLLQYRYIDW